MLDLLFGGPRKQAGGWDGWGAWGWGGFGWQGGRTRTQAGTVVDQELALTYSALWCGVRAIAETLASLPLITYQSAGDDTDRSEAKGQPLYTLLRHSPAPQCGSMAFREGRTAHQILWGQGFAEIERGGRTKANPAGEVVALWPVHPGRVTPVRPADGMPGYSYWVRNNDGTRIALRLDELLHVPGVLTDDGVWGKSVVAYGRESIGMGLGVERHGATYFGSGGQPRGIITGLTMRDSDARRTFRQEWKEIHGSPDSAEIAILPVNATYTPLSITNEDAQFLGTRKFNVTEIARWLRLPPHILMDLDRATNNNIEQQGIEFVMYGLLPWARRWEEQITLKLVPPNRRATLFAEHRFEALMRGDIQSRMNAYKTGLMSGVLTLNDVCRMEGLNHIDGPEGDQHWMPLNMTTAQALAASPPEPGSGGRGGIGSDQSGFPAEGGDGDAAAAFDAWARKRLTRAQRQDLNGHLRALEGGRRLPRPFAAAAHADAAPLAVPDFRQELPFSCGAAATRSAHAYLAEPLPAEADYRAELGTTPEDGTSPEAIAAFFAGRGFATEARGGMTLADLAGHHAAGDPVIVPLQMYGTPEEEREDRSGHYVVVTGVAGGRVTFQDPGRGPNSLPAEEFDGLWHDREAGGKEADHFGIAVGAAPDGKAARDGRPRRLAYDENEERDDHGRWTSGGGLGEGKGSGRVPEERPSAKAERAKAAHVLVDRDVQRYAEEHNEPRFAARVGGVSFPDGEAADVVIPKNASDLARWQRAADEHRAALEAFHRGEGPKPAKFAVGGGAAHGAELKTMVSNGNDKLTMKGSAQDHKADWEVANKATFHTVVYDDRAVKDAKGNGRHDESKRQIYYKRGAGSFRTGSMHKVKDHDELKRLMAAKEKDLPAAARPSPQWKGRQAAARERASGGKGGA